MSSSTHFDPEAPELVRGTKEALKAEDAQISTYPQIVRQHVDPGITGQSTGIVSFMLLKEPKKSQDGKPVYGFMKLRGNYESQEVALAKAKKLVRDVDSKYEMKLAPVGVWVPITETQHAVQQMYDVKGGDDEHPDSHKLIRDDAFKEKEAERKAKMKELEDATKQLKEGSDIYDDTHSLDFYTMKRVTEMHLVEELIVQEKKYNDLKEKVALTRGITLNLESEHPEYRDKWLDNYNGRRAETGIPEFKPGADQFKGLEESTIEDIIQEYPDLDISIPEPYYDPTKPKKDSAPAKE